MTPRASILIPARDAGDTIDACLRSVVRQTEPSWECVVVDDGSSDDTLARVRGLATSDARFVVVAGPARGLVAALRTGLDACRAAVVVRMDADDVMHRDRLAAQLAALDAAPGLAAVGSHVRVVPRAGLTDGLRAYERWLNGIDSPRRVLEEAFVECPVAHPTLAIRTDVLRAAGYRDVGWPEDYDLVLRLLTAGHEIGVVPRRLVCWRDRPTRLTRTGAAYALDRITACKAAFLATRLLAASDEYVLWGYGGTGRALRRALLAHGKRPSHVVEVHPGRLGQRIHGARVVGWETLPALRHRPVVVSVAGERARREIRAAMAGMGFRETYDFVCAA